jgi:hypothetical protein
MDVSELKIVLGGTDTKLLETVRPTCLGLTVDIQLTFAEHVKKLSGECLHQLRQLRTVCHSLSVETAFTLNHVGYCSSVLNGMCANHLHPLQSVLNAAACLVTGKRKV